MSRQPIFLFHLAVVCNGLRCGAYGTFCYGISQSVITLVPYLSRVSAAQDTVLMPYLSCVFAAQDPNSIITALGGYATLSAEDVTQVLNIPLPTQYTLQCSNTTSSTSNSTAVNGTSTTNSTNSSTTPPTSSSCALTAPGSPLLRPTPSFVGIGVTQMSPNTGTTGTAWNDPGITFGPSDTILKPSKGAVRESSLLTRGSSSGGAGADANAGEKLLIPAGAIAGLAIGVLIIIGIAWMVTAHIATSSRLKNTGKEQPGYVEDEVIGGDDDSAGELTAAAAATMMGGNSGLKAKDGAMESPRAAAPAELIGTSADGGQDFGQNGQNADEEARALNAVAAAAGFFLPVSHSVSETAYGGSFSGNGVQRSAARPGRPKALVQEVRVRRSLDIARGTSGSAAGVKAHVKDT